MRMPAWLRSKKAPPADDGAEDNAVPVPRDAIVVLRDLRRDYHMGGETIHALDGMDLTIHRGRVHEHHGALRIGEVNAAEYDRVSRQPDKRPSHH